MSYIYVHKISSFHFQIITLKKFRLWLFTLYVSFDQFSGEWPIYSFSQLLFFFYTVVLFFFCSVIFLLFCLVIIPSISLYFVMFSLLCQFSFGSVMFSFAHLLFFFCWIEKSCVKDYWPETTVCINLLGGCRTIVCSCHLSHSKL